MNLNVLYHVNKKIILIIISIFLSSLIILYSNYFGLGVNESFFLFKYGIRRSQLFAFLLFLLAILIKKTIIRKVIVNRTEIPKNKVEKIYLFFLFFAGCIKTILKHKEYTSFHWNNLLDLVLSYKLINPDILNNDFITLSNYNSPKIIYAYFISLSSKIGLEPLLFCECIDLLVQLFSLPMLFILICKIVRFNTKSKSENFKFFLFCFFIFETFTYTFQENLALAGFRPFFDLESISYSSDLSLFIGLNFLLFYKKKRNFLNVFLFSLTVLINPLIGIFIFIIWAVSFFSLSKTLKNSIIFTIVLVAIGIAEKVFFYEEAISNKDFINIYIFERHSHHYVLSKIVNYRIIILLIIFLIPVIFTRKSKWNNFHIKSTVVLFLMLITHYLFIEIYPTKIFSILTINRFSIFSLFLLLISYCILLNNIHFNKNLDKYEIKNFNFNINKKVFIKKKYVNKIIFLTICLMTIVIPKKRVEGMFDDICPDYFLFNIWIDKNTSIQDVFQVFPTEYKLNFFVRIFAQRNIYWGEEFTFNEKDFKKWHDRKFFYNEIFKKENARLIDSVSNEIDYIIVKKDKIDKKIINLALVEFENFCIFNSRGFFKDRKLVAEK